MARLGDWVGPGGLLHYAICPIDIALWDAWGKTIGQPIFRLLGGARDGLDAYASDGFSYSLSLDALAASAQRAAEQGFLAVKLRVGNERHSQGEVVRVEAVRAAVGEAVEVMVDAPEAGPPIAPSSPGGRWRRPGYVGWKTRCRTPNSKPWRAFATRWESRWQWRAYVHARPVRPHAARRGGGYRAARSGARGRGDAVAVDRGARPWFRRAGRWPRAAGNPCPPLSGAPNGHRVEYVPRSARLLRAMPALSGTRMLAPDAPGFGLALDRDALALFTVEGSRRPSGRADSRRPRSAETAPPTGSVRAFGAACRCGFPAYGC